MAPEPQATPPEQEVIREAAPVDRSKTSPQRQASSNAVVSRRTRDIRRHARQRDRGDMYVLGRGGRRYRIDPGYGRPAPAYPPSYEPYPRGGYYERW